MRELLRRWRERVLRVQVEKWEEQGEPHVLAPLSARHPLGTALAYFLWALVLVGPSLIDCYNCSPTRAKLMRLYSWAFLALWSFLGYRRSKAIERALHEYQRRGNDVPWPKPFDWLEAVRTVSLMGSVVALGALVVALVGGARFAALVALGAAAVFAPLTVFLQARHRRR